tara:strand:- start:231 stop:740 length:510 start_codon:yes stop_codon:yes gene_type:complete
MGRRVIYRWATFVAVVAFVVDRLSKWWFLDVFRLPERGVVEVLPILNFVMVWNRGISFGLLPAEGDLGRWILVAVTLLIVIFLAFWLRRVNSSLLCLAIGLVIGGAIGNIYDRIVFGAVADFFQFHALGYAFAVFNVADAAISIGAALMVWDALFGSGQRDPDNNTKEV